LDRNVFQLHVTDSPAPRFDDSDVRIVGLSTPCNGFINAKRTEIMQTMKEVYATLTKMYDLD